MRYRLVKNSIQFLLIKRKKNLLKYLSGLFVKMFLVQTVVSLIFTKFTEDIKDLFLPWSNVNTA